jgi:hypothetical protein
LFVNCSARLIFIDFIILIIFCKEYKLDVGVEDNIKIDSKGAGYRMLWPVFIWLKIGACGRLL